MAACDAGIPAADRRVPRALRRTQVAAREVPHTRRARSGAGRLEGYENTRGGDTGARRADRGWAMPHRPRRRGQILATP